MNNIFKNIKFGDKFRTKDGRMAIAINVPHCRDVIIALTVEKDKNAFYYYYDMNGIAKKMEGDTDGVDIVSRWEE